MKIHTAATLAAMLAIGVSGCTTPQATTRGQNVEQAGHTHNVNVLPNRSGRADTIQGHFHDKYKYADTASYHSTSGFPGYGGFAQSCPPGATCPPGAACPPGGCRYGQCGPGGCRPHHYHSYSYERPGNLVYPAPNAVGGSVVYPYYTHKGPSDFFRDDCDRR